MESDRKHITLPRIGALKTHESTRKLARRLEQRQIPTGNGKAGVVGVDAGIRYLAVLSTGAVIANPQALHGSLRKLRRLHSRLVVADRFHPSSKTCSACGSVKAKLPCRPENREAGTSLAG